jgi:hypothetical protein
MSMGLKEGLHEFIARPAFLLAVIAFLTALIVHPGNLGHVDAGRRLQVAHSFWTDEPPVVQGTDKEFGIQGKSGRLEAWYGIGQSLLMLPADIIASKVIGRSPTLRAIDERKEGGLRHALVAYQISPLICTLCVLLVFHLLRILGFNVVQAIGGGLTLLFGTTFLHYTQIAQENNFILLFTLLGFFFQYRWTLQHRRWLLILGAAAFGFNLLTRLTTALDLLAGALFISICLWQTKKSAPDFRKKFIEYGFVCAPIYALFFLGDRLYHYHRFGNVFGTYIHVFGEQWRVLHPELPASFPFSNPFWEGFLGPLVSPHKSIFLFDPMLILTLVLLIRFRTKIARPIKALLFSLVVLLFAYISFYAKFFAWAGDAAWGDRYVATSVHLLAMFSIPLFLRFRGSLKSITERTLYSGMAGLSVVIQCASIILSFNLELQQMQTLPVSKFVVGLRFTNLLAMATGNFENWGLGTGVSPLLKTINLMPFAAAAVVSPLMSKLIFAFWGLLILLLATSLLTLAKKIRSGDYLQQT